MHFAQYNCIAVQYKWLHLHWHVSQELNVFVSVLTVVPFCDTLVVQYYLHVYVIKQCETCHPGFCGSPRLGNISMYMIAFAFI